MRGKEKNADEQLLTQSRFCEERWEHFSSLGHTAQVDLDTVFITVYPFKAGPVVKAVNGLWLANDSYVPRQALEYSATVNSFIESEALTPLKAAEHPRLKVNTKQRCLCSLPLYVSQKRKTGSTCCTHEAQFQYSHLYKAAAFVLYHSHTSCHWVSSWQSCITTNEFHFKRRETLALTSFFI